jgi:TolB protein
LQRLSAFDRTVAAVVLAAVAALAVLIWRGDRVGLRALAFSPAAGADAVPVGTSIGVRFAATLGTNAGAARVELSPPVTGTLAVNGDTLNFTPAAALAPGTLYTVTLDGGITAQNGRTLLAPLTWQFRTGAPQVLFTSVDATGAEQLYATELVVANDRVSAAVPRALTNLPYGVWDFAVAPRGGATILSALTETGGADLWRLEPGSTEPALLLACPNAACSGSAWSPDGKLVAFSKRNVTDIAATMISPPRLWLLDPASGESAPVFDDNQRLAFDPRWSSDSEWLSYFAPGRTGVGVVNLEDGREAFFPTGTGEVGVWQPGAKRMVMSVFASQGEQTAMYLMAVDPVTGEQTNLSGDGMLVEDNAPVFSPDGGWIAFRRKEFSGERATPGKQLWMMRADGGDARPLTSDAAFDHGPALWSPDGRYLLYHKFPLKGPNIVVSVWVLDVTTGQEWEVARPGQRPQWLP